MVMHPAPPPPATHPGAQTQMSGALVHRTICAVAAVTEVVVVLALAATICYYTFHVLCSPPAGPAPALFGVEVDLCPAVLEHHSLVRALSFIADALNYRPVLMGSPPHSASASASATIP